MSPLCVAYFGEPGHFEKQAAPVDCFDLSWFEMTAYCLCHEAAIMETQGSGEGVVLEVYGAPARAEEVPNGVDPGSRDVGEVHLGQGEDAAMEA